MPTTSYWLSEPYRAASDRRARRPARRRRRRRRHHGVLVRARTRRGRPASSSLRSESDRRRREREERRIRTPGRRCAVSRHGRGDRARARAGALAMDAKVRWPILRRSPGIHSGQPEASASPRTRPSARSSSQSTTRFEPTGSRASGAISYRRRSPARIRARSSIRPTASSIRRGSSAGSRPAPRLRGSRYGNTSEWVRARRRKRDVVSSDGRLPERATRPIRGSDRPDSGPGDRDGAGGAAPLRDTALRPPRLRLLAPAVGRAHRGRRLPRRLARFRVHRRRRDDTGRSGSARTVRRAARRTHASHRLPLGRDLRARLRLPARRRTGPGAGRNSGWRAGTRATATCSASPVDSSSHVRFSATATRCSISSSLRGSSSTSRVSASRKPSRVAARLRPRSERGSTTSTP